MSRACVYLYTHRRIADITPQVSDIDRSFALMGIGDAAFSLPSNSSYLTPQYLALGTVIVIASTATNVLPWIGMVDQVTPTTEATVQIRCVELTQVFDERKVDQGASFNGVTAREALGQLLAITNARLPTGFHLRRRVGGPPLEDVDVGGQQLSGAIETICRVTGWEWWPVYNIQQNEVEPWLVLGYRRGRDRRNSVRLYARVQIGKAERTLDRRAPVSAVTVVSSQHTAAASAVGVTRQTTVVPIVDWESWREARNLDGPVGTRYTPDIREYTTYQTIERLVAEPTVTSAASAQKVAQTIVQEAKDNAEIVRATCVLSSLPVAPLEPGDYVTIVSSAIDFGQASSRVCRVTSLQPDEAANEMHMTLAVQ